MSFFNHKQILELHDFKEFDASNEKHSKYLVKEGTGVLYIEDVLNTPIKSSGDSVITFRDIASIKRTFEDRQSYANVNGSNSVTIQVSKRIGENIIQTIDVNSWPNWLWG